VRIEHSYGLIERDGCGEKVFFRMESSTRHLSDGERVQFVIAFNYRGPVALDILSELL